ncbi:MAG: TIGR04282 family arsenosugar biosynthesis glycosyltransferase [Planctomycetota bacterium]
MNSSSFSLPAVLVMARHWAVGPVKTRLAAGIGQQRAREVYRDMAEQLWENISNPLLSRHLWVSPAEELEACHAWLQGADRTLPQPQGDLGERMLAAFEDAKSNPWAAIIGTDCPAINAEIILQAGAALTKADVFLIPTFDGGYALMALNQPQPGLFENMPWSTSNVLQHTLDRAKDLDLRVMLGETQRDLDNLEDLQILQSEGLLRKDEGLT